MLNPSLLREYSKRSTTSGRLKKKISTACSGISVALSGVFISWGIEPLILDNDSPWRFLAYIPILGMMAYCAWVLGSVMFFVERIAMIALDEKPHPDRLKTEEQELKWRLTDIQRQMRDSGDQEPEYSRDPDD